MDGHKHIGGVNHHGDGREEDRVEDGLFPWLQDIDTSDEEVLEVQPSQILLQILKVHSSGSVDVKSLAVKQ